MTTIERIIIETVADYYEINLRELLSGDKKTLLPRQIAMYLDRNITGDSFSVIADRFDRNHVIIRYACQKIETAMASDKELETTIASLREQIFAREKSGSVFNEYR